MATRNSNFATQLAAFAAKSSGLATDISREAIARLGAAVITETPVADGVARGAWNASVGAPDRSFSGALDPAGSEALARLSVEVQTFNVGDVFYLANSAPHIVALEYGHSDQAPGGMTRVNVANFAQMVEAAARGHK